MPRVLDEHDLVILRKLAPECEEMICSGSGVEFRSLLPPVANHYAKNEEDFRERLNRLDNRDLVYLIEKMRSGEESVACIPPEMAEVLIDVVNLRIGKPEAGEVLNIYMTMDEC